MTLYGAPVLLVCSVDLLTGYGKAGQADSEPHDSRHEDLGLRFEPARSQLAKGGLGDRVDQRVGNEDRSGDSTMSTARTNTGRSSASRVPIQVDPMHISAHPPR